MKFLLIMPYNCDLIHAVSIPTGILSIATYLNANGHKAKICDLSATHCDIKRNVKISDPISSAYLCARRSIPTAPCISQKS